MSALISQYQNSKPSVINMSKKISIIGGRGFTGQDIESVDNYFARTQAIDPKKGGAQGEDNPDYDIIPDNVAKLSKLTEKDAMYISVIKQLITRIEALES